MSGWRIVRLADVAKVGAGNSAPQDKALFEGGTYPFFRTADVGRVKVGELRAAQDHLNERGIRGLKLHPAGTMLIPKSGASTFLDHRVIMTVDGYVSSHLATLYANEDLLDRRYLFWVMQTISARDVSTDTSYPTLSLGQISEIHIPLPPLEEQRQIVAVLDEAFAVIDTATANVAKNLTNSRELFALALDEELDRGFSDVPMRELCEFENGDRGENYAGRSAFVDEGIPIINAGHLTDGDIDTQSMNFITRDRFDLLRSGKIKRGDILFCLRGSLGKFAFNDVYDEGAIASSLIIIRPRARILPDYLCAYLRSDLCIKMIRHYENGTAQPNLGGKSLEKFLVPLPNLPEQQAIIDRLGSVRNATQDMEALYDSKLSELTALKQSLLHRAFSGELTEREPLAA